MRFYQVLSKDSIEAISILLDNSAMQSLAFMFFDSLAAKRPTEVMAYEAKIIFALESNKNVSFLAVAVLAKLAVDEVVTCHFFSLTSITRFFILKNATLFEKGKNSEFSCVI